MKKLFLSLALMASMLFTACQKEEMNPNAQGASQVTFSVEIPDVAQTRAIEENGGNINDLVYAVYRTEAEKLEDAVNNMSLVYQKNPQATAFQGGVTNVSIELMNDQNYVILFWAQISDAWVTGENFDLTNITYPKHRKLTANNADWAAFSGVSFIKNVNGASAEKVTLTRPFAQINVGTTLPKEFTVNLTTSDFKVNNAGNAFNVATQMATETTPTVAFGKTSLSNLGTLKVNNKDYVYVAMNYIFAKEDVDVEFNIATEAHGTVNTSISNVPVAKNYKTNIVGNLLTSNVSYEVTLDDNWDGAAHEVKIWDGETLAVPQYDADTKTWTINNGEELAWIANAVNGTLPAVTKTTEEIPAYEKTQLIVLGNNINLGDNEWIPIGTNSKHFMGTFDGAGYKIENFRINKFNSGAQAALFGTVSGSPTFKNLTISKAKVVYPGTGDFYAAALVGTAYGNLTIKNVTVINSEISGNNKVAALLAHDGVMSSLNIDNCHVISCKIESLNAEDGGNVGGLIGLFQGVAKKAGQNAPYGDHIIKNSSVKNTVINAINSTNSGKRSNGEFVACIAGKDNQTLVIENCEISGNTFTQNEGVTYVSPYGAFVGGNREDNGKGVVIVDGTSMIVEGLTMTEGVYSVSSLNALKKVFDIVNDNETIKLESDLSFVEDDATNGNAVYYTGDKSFTIDLNGKTLSGNTSNVLIRIQKSAGEENTITIKNGTIVAGENTWSAISIGSSCDSKTYANLEGLVISSQKANDMAVRARSGAEFTMTDCNVTAINGAGGVVAGGGNVTLNNVNIAQTGVYNWNSVALGISGAAKMTVNSGSYTSNPDGNAKGTWVAYVMTSGGTLEINGGTFNGTVAENADASNACGIICADTKAVVKINNGTFTSNGAILDMRNNTGQTPNPTAVLAGGTFSSDPRVSGLYGSNLITVAGGCAVKEENNLWTVSFCAVATIGSEYYFTLDEAIKAAKEGDTITILEGTIEEETIKLPSVLKNVTICGAEGAVLKNMNISAADGNSYNYENLKFDGITFDNSRIVLTGWRNGEETIKDLTITNCTFINLNDNTNTAPVHINKDASEAVNGFTFTNNVIDGAVGGSKSGVYAQVTGKVLVSGNIINNVAFRPYVIQITTNDGISDEFNVIDNVFSGSSIGRAQGLGSDATGNDEVKIKVSENIFKGITDSQQICYWNFNSNTTVADLSHNYYDIDILANPNKIYYNVAANSVEDLIEMGIYPIYTALKSDGTIDKSSLYAPVVSLNNVLYSSLEEAIAAVKAGETIKLMSDITLSNNLTLPADVIFNGNGKQINGTIIAGGNLSFAGHTKVTSFSASYYNRTITINEGACLEVTGTGRVTFGYGNTFNIKGSVNNAKEADKSTIKPSMIIPGGISITGANDFTMNLKDAYVKVGNTSSKNSAANGTFNLNIENSIAEFTNQLTFAEPTNGMNPTFIVKLKNSVLTTATKFCVAAKQTNVTLDNSTISASTYVRNSGTINLTNGSVLEGSTIQFGENGGNDGAITVDKSTLTIKSSNSAHAFDGKGTGSITLNNNATASVDYYKAMTINVDNTSSFTGTKVE